MDGIVTALKGAFTGPGALGNVLKTGVTAAGGIGDIIAQQKQNSSLDKALAYQKNPALAAQQIRAMTQPLSQGLTEGVGNNVQGYLGERGLSGSPNITAAVLAQALAPYQQQNQTTAADTFGRLINPAGASFAKPIDWASMMKLWMPSPKIGTGSGVPSTPTSSSIPNSPAATPPFLGGDINWQDSYGGGSVDSYGGGQ